MCIVGSCLTICVGESIVKLALTHKYVYHLEPLQRDIVLIQSDCYCAWASQDPCKPKIPVSPRSQSTQDPSQPKIPVNPRSQSAQDPSQPWMPSCLLGSCLFGSCLFGIWLMPIWIMPIWYLAHAYLIFGSCLFGSWLMWNPHQLNFTYLDFSHSYLAHAHFPSLKNAWAKDLLYSFFCLDLL